MTVVNIANNNSSSQDRISSGGSDLEKLSNGTGRLDDRDRIMYGKLKACGEVETDQESTGSSEDMDSPRSVARVRKWPVKDVNVRVHSQILRIREEDSHIGDGIGEGLSSKDKLAGHHVEDLVVFRRPILPASPLGDKTAVKMVH